MQLGEIMRAFRRETAELTLEEEPPEGDGITLGPVQHPRRGSWHAPCPVCREAFKETDEIRRVRYADGTRPFVHAEHLRPHAEEAGVCRHGMADGTCSWCNGTDPYVSFPLTRTFAAKRPGACVKCGERFGRGTLIVKGSTARGVGWCHAFHLEDML